MRSFPLKGTARVTGPLRGIGAVYAGRLAKLDQNELATIPSFQDGDGRTQFEAARRATSGKFGDSVAASQSKVARACLVGKAHG